MGMRTWSGCDLAGICGRSHAPDRMAGGWRGSDGADVAREEGTKVVSATVEYERWADRVEEEWTAGSGILRELDAQLQLRQKALEQQQQLLLLQQRQPVISEEVLDRMEYAAGDFSRVHHAATSYAREVADSARRLGTGKQQREFESALARMRHNRYRENIKYDPFPPSHGKANRASGKHQRRWYIENSVWEPRRKTSPSSEFLETEASIVSVFEVDWEQARQGHRLEDIIYKKDVDILSRKGSITARPRTPRRGGGGTASAEEGGDDAVEQVEGSLRKHCGLLYDIFEHYCVTCSVVADKKSMRAPGGDGW